MNGLVGKVGLFEINMLYLTFVLRSVFEVCNFEFGPFYNYPFFRVRRPVSGQDRGMTIFFRPIIAIIGPGAPGVARTSPGSSLCSVPTPGQAPRSSIPLAISFSRPGLSLPSNCRSDQLCSQEISQPKQGCYVRASAIRLHHLPSSELCASQCLSGPD